MMNIETDHSWSREQMATALADGLRGDERVRFDAHLAACEACVAEYAAMSQREQHLAGLFADARPAPGFEDRLIRSLRQTKSPRTWVHPMVRRAATGVAAALLLASAGYVVSSASNGGKLPDVIAIADRVKDASNLRQIGQAIALYSNENKYAYGWFEAPRSGAEKDVRRYGTEAPYLAQDAIGSGFKLNNSISAEFATGADVNAGPGAGGRSYKEQAPSAPAAQPGQKPAEEKAQMFANGHLGWDKNPFSGTKRDNVDTKRGGEGEWKMGRSMAQPPQGARDADDAALVPTDRFHDWDADKPALPAVDAFKPFGAPPSERKKVQDESGAKAAGKPVAGRELAEGVVGGLKVDDTPHLSLQSAQTPGGKDGGGAAGGVVVGDQVVPVAPAQQPPPQQQQQQPAPSRKVIRTGAMEFEVDRFDAALAMITKLTQEAGGYVGTTDSEKLPNGKVKGTIVVRVPPDRLDTLVLQLRGIGDLRSQKMDAQDVTKQYTDLEGELRAARAMEERLLEIIKTGKGEIKDLLAAEKELGVWRTKIEKMVGEMRYYDNLVALTTLTVTVFERDIRTAAAAKETETVDAGIETDDVETARAAALKAIDEAKGRVIQSDLKRHDAGQFSAVVVAEVSPDKAGPLVDRLKQLGKVARFEVQRRQTTPEGTQPAPGARLDRAETRINLSLYNLANVAPRQTTHLNLAAADVEAAYKAIAARVEKAGGRVVTSNLSRPQAEQVVGAINFEVKSAEAEAVLGDLRGLGEVMRLTVTENPDTNNVTTAKQGFVVQLASVAAVAPRESTNLQIAAPEVPAAYNALREAVRATPSNRVTTSQLNEAQRENVTAIIDFEVMRADLPAVEEVIKKLGDVTQRTSGRSGDTENTVDSKVRLQVSFVDADQLPPRETTALGIETSDPDKALADVQSIAAGAGGRVITSALSQERGGQTVARFVVDVPLAKSVELITRAKGQGSVRMVQSTKDAQVPEGSLARARVDMTFATSAAIVSPDRGVWASIRRGLATSMTGLMWSLQLIIIGLCFVGPWVVVIALLWKLLKRRRTSPVTAPATV